MASSRTIWLLGALASAGVLYVLSRTKAGETAAADALEAIVVNAKKLTAWSLPSAGEPYRKFFQMSAARWNVPEQLLARQAYQESRFRADIVSGRTVSSAGAIGIMQIIPKWHPELDPGDAASDRDAALDPPRAIDYAAKYLRSLFNQFGSWSLALAAYNAGPANVKKFGGIPPFAETQAYVREITGDVGLA